MLFPAVHELGFKVGQVCYQLWFAATVGGSSSGSNEVTPPPQVSFPTTTELWTFIWNFPTMYKAWWLNLVENDPLHVMIETTLIISIVYMIVSRNTEGYKNNTTTDGSRLTPQEQDELVWEWKHKLRQPLAPPATSSSTTENNEEDDDDFQIVVQKQEGKWLTITTNDSTVTPFSNSNNAATPEEKNDTDEAPPAATKASSTTTTLVGIMSKKKRNNRGKNNNNSNNGKSTKSVQLLPPQSQGETTEQANTQQQSSSSSSPTPLPLRVLNFCNFDFLGLQTSDTIRNASTAALNKYGCGSCGPRGFYGTIDTHLQLEDEISNFTHTDNAIMYSDGASTCSSTVAAFAKRGDVLVVDEGVYEPITTGVTLSRANVHWFKHNDVEDLERVLKELEATDRRLKRKPNAQRRFIVVEGLYKNIGSIAPIDQIVALKHKYHYRLMLDESFSFGTLGPTGRGVLEEYHKRPMYDAEIITIALENSLGSVGGVTVGNEEVVDHQRLSGAGYCFSASAPPFTASAAIAALRLMENQPELVSHLQSNVRYLYQQLDEKLSVTTSTTTTTTTTNGKTSVTTTTTTTPPQLVVTSDPRSPIVVLQLERESVYESTIMKRIMKECLRRGIAIVATGQDKSSHLRTELAPCLRMTVSSIHTQQDIDDAVSCLVESSKVVLEQFPSLH